MEILLGALAEAILSLLLADVAERPKLAEWREKILRGNSPEKLAVQKALAAAYAAFSQSNPELAHSFFDEHLLQKPEVVGELAKALTPNRTPDTQALIGCWREQYPDTFQDRLPDITEAVGLFLSHYQEEVTAQPALRLFADSRATQESYRHTGLLEELRDGQIASTDAINALIAEMRQLILQGNRSIERWVVIAQPSLRLSVSQPYALPQARAGSYPPTPFSDRGRINDPARFFGRQRILRDIQQYLRAGNCVSVVGESQIGKSSLLYYLYTTRDSWVPGRRLLYLDLQGVLDEEDFCSELLDLLEQPGDNLRALRRALRGQAVTLLLDEMEKLTQPDFTPRLRDLLRALVQEGNLRLLVASQQPLSVLFPPLHSGEPSPFHNLFMIQRLLPFSSQEAADFLAQRLADTGVVFSDSETEELLAASAGHPAHLQELAHALYRDKTSME